MSFPMGRIACKGEMLPLNGLLGPSKELGLTLMGVRSSILAFGAT